MHNTEDKQWWVKKYGIPREEYFIKEIAPKLNLSLIINLEKETDDYAPDLIYISSNKICDLKCQHTPFFKAEVLYGMNPTYTVTFNKKDYERYKEKYPRIRVIFWVNWLEDRWTDRFNKTFEVDKLNGV